MRIQEYALSPYFWIGMFSGFLSFVLFMMEFAKLRTLQVGSTKRDYAIIQTTSILLSATLTFYFAVGGLWGYLAGTAYRRYELANQTSNRADYGTMASEA